MIALATRWRIACLGSAGTFLALAFLVSSWGVLPGERLIYETIVDWTSPTGVTIFKTIKYLGSWQFLLPATLLLLWLAPAEERRRWWLWAGVMVLAPIVEGVGKEIVGRPRPVGHSFGFPSGHVTAAATYFSLVAYLIGHRLKNRAIVLWIAVWVPVALVGIARIVQRAHWPADLLGGAALGLAFASAACWWHEGAKAMKDRNMTGSVVAASIFCVLAGSPAWAQQATPAEELEALKRMMKEVISQNEELQRRIRDLEAAMAKQEQATKEAAKEAAKELAREAPKEPAKAAATEPAKAAAVDPAKAAATEPAKAKKGPLEKIQLGGAIEVEAGRRRDFGGVRTSDFTLATAEFDFEADIVDWAKAELSLQWISCSTPCSDTAADKITVNEALITLGKPSKFPLYLKAGRGVVPFGISTGTTVAAKLEETLTITGPLTVDVFEAKEDHVLLGAKAYGFRAGVYVYDGTTNQVGGGGKRLEHYGVTAGYGIQTENVSFDVGFDLIDSVFDTDGLTGAGAFAPLQNRGKRGYISGLAGHARLGLWGFSLTGEYETAYDEARIILTRRNFHIQPQAWQVEAGYLTELFGIRPFVAFNYSETVDLLGTFPKRRLLGAVGSYLSDNIRVAAEYANEQDYSKTLRGTGRDSDAWTLRLTYEW